MCFQNKECSAKPEGNVLSAFGQLSRLVGSSIRESAPLFIWLSRMGSSALCLWKSLGHLDLKDCPSISQLHPSNLNPLLDATVRSLSKHRSSLESCVSSGCAWKTPKRKTYYMLIHDFTKECNNSFSPILSFFKSTTTQCTCV